MSPLLVTVRGLKIVALSLCLLAADALAQERQKPLERGIEFFRQGKLAPAKAEFERVLRREPKNAVAHQFLAEIFLREKNPARALFHAQLAVKSDPQSAKSHYVLGLVLWEQGRELAAADEFRKALRLAKAPEERARAAELLGKFEARFGERVADVAAKRAMAKREPPSERQHHAEHPHHEEGAPPSHEGRVAQIPTSTLPGGGKGQVVRESAAAKSLPYVAVFPFDDTRGPAPEKKLGYSLAEMLTTALIQSGKFQVVERAQLEKLLQEQSLGQTGALEQETAVEVGKILGVQAVVVGSISQLESLYEADARLVEVVSAKALAATNGHAEGESQMRDLARVLAAGLAEKAELVPVKVDTVEEGQQQ